MTNTNMSAPATRRRGRPWWLATAVVATLTAGIGLIALGGNANAGEKNAALDRYNTQNPAWGRCADAETPADMQCATIRVPVDYKRPAGPTIEVAISRIKTGVAGKRRGVMLFNPGGPGGSGLIMPAFMKEELPQAVRDQYDLIGFDPRGLDQSSPITCGLTGDEGAWLQPYKPETFATDVARARSVADKCAARAGATLPHLTTRNTARDMDVIRGVLGEKKISFIGYSYGTYLGAVYTQLFPGRSDRMVLDSAVDPALAWRGMVQSWAVGSKPAFARWTKWAAARHAQHGLGDTPAKVEKTFVDLVALADRKPIEVDGGGTWTGDDIRMEARAAVFSPAEATELVVTLKKASEGVRGLKAPVAPTAPRFAPAEVPEDNSTALFWAVLCGDASNWPRDPEKYRRDAVRDKARFPLAGDVTSNVMPCAFWKPRNAEPATVVDNKVGALVVQNEWDSQTPLFTALGLHRAMKGSRLVYVEEGEGHGVYGSRGNPCAYKAVNDYLLTGKLPRGKVTCQAMPLPGDAASLRGLVDTAAPIPARPDRF